MHSATDTIEVKATPEQTWQILSDLPRLPEWYVPAQSIKIMSAGPVREGWQFTLAVKTLSGLVLDALGTVKQGRRPPLYTGLLLYTHETGKKFRKVGWLGSM